MHNLRGLRGISRLVEYQMHRLRSYGVDESVLRWFGHMERMKTYRITKRFYVGEFAGSRSRKRWIDTVKECLKRRGLDVRQAKRIVKDRSEWRDFVKENAWVETRE